MTFFKHISKNQLRTGVIAAVILGLLFLALLLSGIRHPAPTYRFVMHENGVSQWYELSGTNLLRISGSFDTTSSTTVMLSSEGVVRVDPKTGTKSILLSRPGLSDGQSAIAPDARMAALENPVTHAIDVFSVGYGGTATSYINSIPVVPFSIAFASPIQFVVHDKDGYELFTVGKSAASKTATLTLQ